MPDCLFCEILQGNRSAATVFEDPHSVAILDHRPLFAGHMLLMPREHVETLPDLPASLVSPLFGNAQLLARAVEKGLGADGSFVAVNNRVSQSVPHLHIHIVPRKFKDGLKGFFWPRTKYQDGQQEQVVHTLRETIAALQKENGQ